MRAYLHSRRRRPSARLRLETLEDRCVPTVYAITDLGANVTPVALNNNGAVVGYMTVSGQAVPFLFENGAFTTLTGLTSVASVNDSNEVSGGTNTGGVLWNNGVITPAGLEGALADNGTIAGGYSPAEVDVNGTVTALPDSNDFLTEANTISGNGQYVGGFDNNGNVEGEGGPALWNLATGQVTVLNVDGLGQTNGVNNLGQAVGQYGEDSGGSAFLYCNGQFMDLGLGNNSSANAINDKGAIVGLGAGGFNPFVYSNGVATNLQGVLSGNSGFTLTNAVGINDNGQILATATNAGGTEHTLLLNPVATTSFALSGFSTTTTAGTAQNLTVTVLNPNGTVDTGYTGTVHFTSTDPQASLPANYTFTAANAGAHTFSFTLKTAGTQSVSVTDTSTATLFAQTPSIEVNPGAPTHFNLIVISTTVKAGQEFYILAEPTDAYGNLTNFSTNTTVHFSDSVSGATLPANFTYTPNVNVPQFLVKLTKRGEQTITVTDLSDPAISGSITIDVT